MTNEMRGTRQEDISLSGGAVIAIAIRCRGMRTLLGPQADAPAHAGVVR